MLETNPSTDSTHKSILFVLLPLIACIFLVITCGNTLYQAAVNNAWSLNYEQYAMGGSTSLAAAPLQHPRAALWLARSALAQNDPYRAQALVATLANGGSAEALVILGDADEAQGQFNEALTAWSNAGAYNSLITAAADAKTASHLEDALLAFKAAYKLDPETGAISLATFLLDTKNNPEGAAIVLQTVIHQFPQSAQQADWCYSLGRAYSKEKQYLQADHWFAQAIVFDPKNQSYWMIRANTARDSGNSASALDLYIQATQQFPDYAPIYYEMAWAYQLAGSYTDAGLTIEKAIQLASPANAWYEVRAGQIYTKAGRLEKALLAYQAAQAIDPGVGTSSLISFYRSPLKDTNGAISALKRAIQEYPLASQHTGWMLQLAGMYRDAKSWPEAKSVYQEIITQDPANIQAYIGQGWVDYSSGEGVTAAQNEFQNAIDVDSTKSDGYYAIAQMLVKEQLYSDADVWYAEAITRSHDNQSWWIERGNNARTAGNLLEAIEIYTQALQRFQNFASGYYELAWAYRLNNDKNDAVQAIEKAITLLPSPSEWYFVRAGQIYEWEGAKDKAITAYQKALHVNPANSSAKDGLARLGQ